MTIIDLTDDSARVNALVSGAVDAIDSVPYALIPSVQANTNLQALISQTGNWYPITMRVDRAPFNDPRVRQAFKWIVDRPQMIKEAYGGRARLGNDLFAIDDPVYAHGSLQRQQDIEKAKFLLKQAGHDGLTVNLVTAPIENGVVESCVVFAQQAKAAGVNVQLTKLDNTTFYNNQYLQRMFSVDWWDAETFLSGVAYTLIPTAHTARRTTTTLSSTSGTCRPQRRRILRPRKRSASRCSSSCGTTAGTSSPASWTISMPTARRSPVCHEQDGLQPELLGLQGCLVRVS